MGTNSKAKWKTSAQFSRRGLLSRQQLEPGVIKFTGVVPRSQHWGMLGLEPWDLLSTWRIWLILGSGEDHHRGALQHASQATGYMRLAWGVCGHAGSQAAALEIVTYTQEAGELDLEERWGLGDQFWEIRQALQTRLACHSKLKGFQGELAKCFSVGVR